MIPVWQFGSVDLTADSDLFGSARVWGGGGAAKEAVAQSAAVSDVVTPPQFSAVISCSLVQLYHTVTEEQAGSDTS
jgi:hypothetical protein